MCVVFDCYQTLVYKKNLETTIQKFIENRFHKKIPVNEITAALDTLYNRNKLQHPNFESGREREKYYVSYNKQLLETLRLKISDEEARNMNNMIDTHTKYSIYNDVLKCLKFFDKEKIPMGILANWTKNLKKVIKEVGISEYFSFITSSSESEYSKPDPRVFLSLISSELKKYSKIYYVGDDYELDIVPARSAGLTPVLIDRKGLYLNKLGFLKINSLTSLINIVFE